MLPGMTSISPLIMVAWSLSYEWFFYLTIPLVLAGLGLRRWTSIQRISLVLFLSAVFLFLVAAGFATHVRLLGFVPGILLWEVVTYRSMVPKLKAWGEYVAIATFLIDVVWFGLATTEHDPTGVVASSVPYSFWLSFYVAAFFLVSYALFFDGILKRIFSWDWLRWLGNISYSYYLIHVLSLHGLAFLLRLLSPPKPIPSVFGIILLLAAFAATLCCGACLFLLVEKPLSLTKAPKPRGPSCVAATELQKSA
jgi:peptidoglycan/LPS O-acetylase OafA/YrhL